MSETRAEMVLQNAGMLAPADEIRWQEIDKIFSGRPAPYRFAEQGDQALGIVHEAYTRQKTKFGTQDLDTWDDGSPKLEAVIELRDTPTGDLKSLYVSSWRMNNALQTAFQEAGVRGPRPGGTLLVRYVADEPGKGGSQPAKVYEAAYDSPDNPKVNPVPAVVSPVAAMLAPSAAPPF
jgi:hypothetical protein